MRSMMNLNEFEMDLGEIHQRWAKRAGRAMTKDADLIQDWWENGSFERIASYVLAAATTGKGD